MTTSHLEVTALGVKGTVLDEVGVDVGVEGFGGVFEHVEIGYEIVE